MKLLDLSNLVPPTQNWLYRPWIERNALTVVVGAGGSGKSYASLDLAVALASGQSWLDMPGSDKPLRAMFIDEDGPEAELMRRLNRLCHGRGIEPASVAGSLFVYPSSGLTLNDPVGYSTLRENIRVNQIEYVIIDALIAIHSLDENKTNDMRLLMRTIIRGLMRDTGVGVAVLHHEARPQNPKTGVARFGAMRARGSTEIINAGDNQLHVKSHEGISTLTSSRCRLLPIDEWPAPITYSIRSHGDESTQVVPVASEPTVSACVGLIRGLMRSGIKLGQVPDVLNLLKERGFTGSRSTVWRAMDRIHRADNS